eukprot:scaffold398873_cov24-Prasinocladus_malaysianus.AAC.1
MSEVQRFISGGVNHDDSFASGRVNCEVAKFPLNGLVILSHDAGWKQIYKCWSILRTAMKASTTSLVTAALAALWRSTCTDQPAAIRQQTRQHAGRTLRSHWETATSLCWQLISMIFDLTCSKLKRKGKISTKKRKQTISM